MTLTIQKDFIISVVILLCAFATLNGTINSTHLLALVVFLNGKNILNNLNWL